MEGSIGPGPSFLGRGRELEYDATSESALTVGIAPECRSAIQVTRAIENHRAFWMRAHGTVLSKRIKHSFRPRTAFFRRRSQTVDGPRTEGPSPIGCAVETSFLIEGYASERFFSVGDSCERVEHAKTPLPAFLRWPLQLEDRATVTARVAAKLGSIVKVSLGVQSQVALDR